MVKVYKTLKYNLGYFQENIGQGPDVVMRRFKVAGQREAALLYLDNMVNQQLVSQFLIMPLQRLKTIPDNVEELVQNAIAIGKAKFEDDLNVLIDAILNGGGVFLLDGEARGVVLDIVKWEKRGVSEPATDVVVRGPHEGFVETMQTNISMIRRKIRHPDLVFEQMKIGRYSQTSVCIVYVKSIAKQEVLTELRERLARIDIDGILESGYIEELIEDNPCSPYPTIGTTEKPDIVAAKVLEGRLALLVDGSPIALTIPLLFVEGFQSAEDYYSRFYYVSFVRIVRYMAYFISMVLPGLYAAITTYHQQLIPIRLLLTMAAAEENTPFSTGLSLLIMVFAYEVLREAGVRMPRPVGQAVSIVGAIVMGDAAVSAGLISAPVLIVVALTVISSFVTVPYAESASVLRILFLVAGWWLGFFGILVLGLGALLYLNSLRSFGIPYFMPFSPVVIKQFKDVFVRFPLWSLQKRPKQLSRNRRRMAPGLRPQPPKKEESQA